MAAVTPSTITRVSLGDLTGHIAVFAGTVDTADTWASGITGIVAVIATQNDSNTTQASAGVGTTVSGSTITLVAGEDNTAITLLVLSRS